MLFAAPVFTGGRLEILLLRRHGPGVWETLVKPARRIKTGALLEITGEDTTTWNGYLAAHQNRRAYFKAHGATSTASGRSMRW